VMDVDHKKGKDGNGNGHGYKNGKDGNRHGYKHMKSDRAASEESLPLLGDLTGTLAGGLPTGGLPLGGGGASSLPVAGDIGSGVKTSKVNVGGVDPMALVSAVPTA